MSYWDSVGRWINTLLLFVVGVIGFDTLFRMLHAQETNVIVGVVRLLSTIALIPFRGMFSEQDYLLTAAMGVLGYAVLVGIALAVLRSIQATTRAPRRSFTVPLQHQPTRPASGTEPGMSQQRAARRAMPQRPASQRPASQRPVERAGSQPTASSPRAGAQRKPAQRVDGQRKSGQRVDGQQTVPQRVEKERSAPERGDTERTAPQRAAATRPDAQTPRSRRPAARPSATPRPRSESGNHNGRMSKPQADTDRVRAPKASADEAEETATTPAGARTGRKTAGEASPPESDNSSNDRSDSA